MSQVTERVAADPKKNTFGMFGEGERKPMFKNTKKTLAKESYAPLEPKQLARASKEIEDEGFMPPRFTNTKPHIQKSPIIDKYPTAAKPIKVLIYIYIYIRRSLRTLREGKTGELKKERKRKREKLKSLGLGQIRKWRKSNLVVPHQEYLLYIYIILYLFLYLGCMGN